MVSKADTESSAASAGSSTVARTVVFLTGGAFTDRSPQEVPNARLGKPFGAPSSWPSSMRWFRLVPKGTPVPCP